MFQVLSGCNLFENGKIIVEDYGPNLDELSEGDRVGVMRTSEVCLHCSKFPFPFNVIFKFVLLFNREIWYSMLIHLLKE